jgi:hypothetical protein
MAGGVASAIGRRRPSQLQVTSFPSVWFPPRLPWSSCSLPGTRSASVPIVSQSCSDRSWCWLEPPHVDVLFCGPHSPCRPAG